jgi:hypothetical protein
MMQLCVQCDMMALLCKVRPDNMGYTRSNG